MEKSKVKISNNDQRAATTLKGMDTKIGDTVMSRLTYRPIEIQAGLIGGGKAVKGFATQATGKDMNAVEKAVSQK